VNLFGHALYMVHGGARGTQTGQRIDLVFYQNDAGNVPVRDGLLGLPEDNR
jgi:hypothetical protein